ncbi:hypothetical protein [Winogradskyella sp. 3972H.M.0a.05]|uniref:hypothetical protein n=1 Tax=Winogradskyella sp. 3972H.M.0a.05 TaxID=2950277 RepID=UPI00339695FC
MRTYILLIHILLSGQLSIAQNDLEYYTNGVEWEGELLAFDVNKLEICNFFDSSKCYPNQVNQRYYFKLVQKSANPQVMMIDYNKENRADYVITSIDSSYQMITVRAYRLATKTKVYFELFEGLDFFTYHESGIDQVLHLYYDRKK